MAVAAAVAAQLLHPRVARAARPGRVDVRGALVLGVGLTLPLFAISEANTGAGGARGRSG